MERSEEVMLIKVSAQLNNNKFYHVKVDTTSGRITKRYGRVGTTGQTHTEVVSPGSAKRRFDSIVREKTRKGYKPTEVVLDNDKEDTNRKLRQIAKKTLVSSQHVGNRELEALIDQLVAINAHEIIQESGGLLSVSTEGVIRTPLGLLRASAITQAQTLLDEMEKAPEDELLRLLEQYLSLVPQKVASKRGWHTTFFNEKNTFASQREFLKQLQDSLSWFEQQKQAKANSDQADDEDLAKQYRSLFRMNIAPLDMSNPEDKKLFDEINDLYRNSRNHRHPSRHLRLKRVFVLTDPVHDEEFARTAKAVGNVKRLWHGTRAFNLLSIFRKGMVIPPPNAMNVTGRMFGDGVYFSDQSTKALNYATSHAPGMRRVNGFDSPNFFMLLADVAMGHEFRPKRFPTYSDLQHVYTGRSRWGKPYNSINVKGGTCGVLNNEMIVWEPKQIRLRYLCEFEA